MRRVSAAFAAFVFALASAGPAALAACCSPSGEMRHGCCDKQVQDDATPRAEEPMADCCYAAALPRAQAPQPVTQEPEAAAVQGTPARAALPSLLPPPAADGFRPAPEVGPPPLPDGARAPLPLRV